MRLPDSFVDLWAPHVLSVLRIVAGFLYMSHGMEKLFGFPAAFPSPVHLMSLIGVAGILECFGGGLLLIGLFTRPVAFLLSGEMAIAYFMAHAPHGFWPIVNKGELADLYCFVFLFFAVAGAGPWSVDYWWQMRARGVARPARASGSDLITGSDD
jgi:putative oxidoreductase